MPWKWGEPGSHMERCEAFLICSIKVCSTLQCFIIDKTFNSFWWSKFYWKRENGCWWLIITIIIIMVTLIRIGTSASCPLITAWKFWVLSFDARKPHSLLQLILWTDYVERIDDDGWPCAGGCSLALKWSWHQLPLTGSAWNRNRSTPAGQGDARI